MHKLSDSLNECKTQMKLLLIIWAYKREIPVRKVWSEEEILVASVLETPIRDMSFRSVLVMGLMTLFARKFGIIKKLILAKSYGMSGSNMEAMIYHDFHNLWRSAIKKICHKETVQ